MVALQNIACFWCCHKVLNEICLLVRCGLEEDCHLVLSDMGSIHNSSIACRYDYWMTKGSDQPMRGLEFDHLTFFNQ